MKNELQAEDPTSLKNELTKCGKFMLSCYFLLYSLGTMIFECLGGFNILYGTVTNFFYQLTIILLLALLGIYSAGEDIKKFKQKKRNMKIPMKILILLFIYFSTLTDAVYYLIDSSEIAVQGFGTEKMKRDVELLSFKAQIAGIFAFFCYPIFFYGNDIWNWIRKREKLIDNYEFKKSSRQPILIFSIY